MSGVMLTKDGPVEFEHSAEEQAQAVIDAEQKAIRRAAKTAEKARVATFTEGPDSEDRQEFIEQLQTATAAQIETFVRNRLNVDAVNDLASAKQAMKRIETGMVVLMKIIALVVRRSG